MKQETRFKYPKESIPRSSHKGGSKSAESHRNIAHKERREPKRGENQKEQEPVDPFCGQQPSS